MKMDVRICKQKCQVKEHSFLLGYDPISQKHTIVFVIDDDSACSLVELQKDVDYRKMIDKHSSYIARFMKVLKECPYYMEHQLSDWNKYECKDM